MNDFVFFVDYDDTLLPTSFITELSIKQHKPPLETVIPRHLVKDFKELEDEILYFLSYIQSKGSIYIVTNAQFAWVVDSCKKFLPKVYQRINGQIPIVSSITVLKRYKENDPNFSLNVHYWKYFSFKTLLANIPSSNCTLVSIGDSKFEQNACEMISKETNFEHKPNKIVAVKLMDNPGVKNLILQLINVENIFQPLVSKNENFTNFLLL